MRHVDRRDRRRRVIGGKDSKVADKVGYALAPDNGLGKRGNWLWAWSLGGARRHERRPMRRKSSFRGRPSKHYDELVASKLGWAQCPSGYADLALQEPGLPQSCALRGDDAELDQFGRSNTSDREAGSLYRRPVRSDPRVPGHRTDVGQDFSAALAGTMTVDAALAKAQASTEAAMKKAGYIK